MENTELFQVLEIPDVVQKRLTDYGSSRDVRMPNGIIGKIVKRSEWDEGIQKLQELLNDDPDGIKILWELLNIVSHYSYLEYVKRNIPKDIFIATMKFCTRFLQEYHQIHQTYKFVWAWWFPRQISLNEFFLIPFPFPPVLKSNTDITAALSLPDNPHLFVRIHIEICVVVIITAITLAVFRFDLIDI